MPSFAAYWAILPILLVVWPAKHIHARPPTYGDEHPGDGEHPMIAPTFDDGEKPAFTFPFIEEPAGSLMQASHGNETVAALMPAAYTVATYPNPQGGSPDDHWACHVDRRGSLCDPDSLLEKAERSELQELITHFPEWTQQANSDNKCVQKGIQLGIALADLPILMNGQSGKGRQHFANSTHRRWLEGVDDLEAKNLFNAAWERMDQLADFHMDPKDKVGERIAKDWKLLAGHAGCNRALLILATAEPRGVHVYAHPSVPILMEERVAIVAGEGDAIARSEYAPALRAIITNLRQVILHRQQMFSGKKATAFAPIPIIWSILVVLAIVASFSALILALAIYIRIRPKIVAIVQMRDVMDGGMGGM